MSPGLRPQGYVNWTSGMLAAVRARAEQGKKLREIAEELGVSPSAVKGKVHALNKIEPIARPVKELGAPYTMAELKLMTSMWKDGETADCIAKAVGREVASVSSLTYRRRDLFPLRHKTITIEKTITRRPPQRAGTVVWTHPNTQAKITMPFVSILHGSERGLA